MKSTSSRISESFPIPVNQLPENDILSMEDTFTYTETMLTCVIASSNIFFELWTVPRNRRALVASLILMFFQVSPSKGDQVHMADGD